MHIVNIVTQIEEIHLKVVNVDCNILVLYEDFFVKIDFVT